MPLTNETSRNIESNLVSDVNANLAVTPNKVRQISPEAAIFFDKSVIARPLLTPEVASIRVKHTEYYYRWVPRPISNSPGTGLMYSQRLAMGFTNATSEDVDVLVGDTVVNETECRCGELILMKLPWEKWASHVKFNMQKASTLANARGMFIKNDVSTDVFSDDRPQRASVSAEPFSRNKAVPFIPDDPDALMDKQPESATTKAKETVKDIRDRIESGRKE